MQKSYPKTHFKPVEKQKIDENVPEKKPFVYINPYQAKKGILPKPEEVVSHLRDLAMTDLWMLKIFQMEVAQNYMSLRERLSLHNIIVQ